MKKVLVVLLMASVVQGSLLLGEYENLQEHLNDSMLTKTCLANSQVWSFLSDKHITNACNRLEEEFACAKRGEKIFPKINKNSDFYQQHPNFNQQVKDVKKSSWAHNIAIVLSTPGDRSEIYALLFVGQVNRESQKYYNALKKASIDAKLKK